MNKGNKENYLKNYVSDIDKKIESLYDEEDSDEDLKKLINLIKLDGNTDFNKAFENRISYLINSENDNNFFDFISTNDETILEFILNYIKTELEIKNAILSKKNKGIEQNYVNRKNDKKSLCKIRIRSATNTKRITSTNMKRRSSNARTRSASKIRVLLSTRERMFGDKNQSKISNKNERRINKKNEGKINDKERNSKNIISINKSKSSINNKSKRSIKNKKEESNVESDSCTNSGLFFSLSKTSFLSQNSNLKDFSREENQDKLINEINSQISSMDEESKIDGENKIKNFEILKPKEEKNNKKVKKIIVIKKDIDFENYEDNKNKIRFFDEASTVNGMSFEYDSINYIFKLLFKISTSKTFSLMYNVSPEINKINTIFEKYNLFIIDKIQMDFIIINLKISELIELLISLYPGIHPNSKISLDINREFITLEDLNKLKDEMKEKEDKIDIIGEVGINIFNEKEKCCQLLKYAKLFHNINVLIKKNAKEIKYILDLLKLNSNNKKLLLFITNGQYSSFINIKNNNFLTIQKKLNVDSLLIFRKKNELFKTSYLEKIVKKYKKLEKKAFDDTLENECKRIIRDSLKKDNYEKIITKLSNIEKKIKYLKKDLYDFSIKNEKFIALCNKIMKIIKDNEMSGISFKNFKLIKGENFNNLFNRKINIKIKIYVIYDNKNKDKTESFVEKLKKYKINFKIGNELDILKEKNNNNIFKIIFFFVDNNFLKNNLNELLELKNEYQINKLYPMMIINYNNIKNEKDQLISSFKTLFGLIFQFPESKEIETIIENIMKNDYPPYKKYINYIEDEIFYKFLISHYIELFNISIYGNKIEKKDKNELLFIKMSQDIQFCKNFCFDDKVSLELSTINDLKNLFENEDIVNLIKDFLGKSNILKEINNALIEFEERINEKINNIKSKNKDKNIDENIDDKKEKKIMNINKKEGKDSCQIIKECEDLLNEKREGKELKEKFSNNRLFTILFGEIKESLEKKVKNEIPIIVYIILQKSIIHLFEKIFLEEYQ